MRTDSEKERKKINRIRKKINRGRAVNKDILKVFVFLAAVFAALIIYMVCFLAFQAGSVINNSYNHRSDVLTKSVERGSILADDGTVLAYSVSDAEGSETRIYPYGNIFAHVVGFSSNGRSGLESSYNYYLLTSHAGIFEKISNEFRHVKNKGDSIQTTLNAGLQTFIYNLLGDSRGAVVCMNPDTGEVYAMVSKPDFDPNTIDLIWDSLVASSGEETETAEIPGTAENSSVLLNRATQGLYTPGSTFKVFTLYEYYLENPKVYDQFTYDCTGSIRAGDTSIACYNNTVHGKETLLSAFANSCNCAFGEIGEHLDLKKFQETLQDLLFGQELPVDIPSSKSRFTLTQQDPEYEIVATAIGQGNTQVTPMHLAMVISSIANEGVCMKPYLVKYVRNPYGEIVTQFRNQKYAQLFTAEEASILKTYLRAVVTDGTGEAVYPGNFQAYGKTGTAQKESELYGDYDHSWFVGWAENNEQKLAVCVILENMDQAGMTGAYVSKLIFDYYFGY